MGVPHLLLGQRRARERLRVKLYRILGLPRQNGWISPRAWKPYTGPVWMGEFGWNQLPANDTQEDLYKTLVIEYMSNNDMDWSLWALQGSYYYMEGQPLVDETFGLLNHNWTDWREPTFLETIDRLWVTSQGP
jgi:endoglucanase